MEKAHAFYVTEQFETALKWYMKVKSDDMFEPEEKMVAQFGVAKCYGHLNKLDQALEVFNRIAKDESANSNLRKLSKEHISRIRDLAKRELAASVKTVQAQKEEVESKPFVVHQDPPKLEESELSSRSYRDKWYQDATSAFFTVYCKNLDQKCVKVYFEPQTVTVDIFVTEEGKTVRRICKLPYRIDCAKSLFRLNQYKLAIQLAKEKAGQWDIFESGEKRMSSVGKDWAKIAKIGEEQEQESEADDSDPNKSIMNMMKKLPTDATADRDAYE